MRKYMCVSAVLATSLALGGGTAIAAPATLDGDRVSAAFATFADPADCEDGSCDALYLTAGTGVLGGGSTKDRVDAIVIVEVYPSAVMEGQLWPVGPPSLSACTYEGDVAIDRALTSGEVATVGRVALLDYVTHDDGSFSCDTPNGHWLDLEAAFAGAGDLLRVSHSSTSKDPWSQRTEGGVWYERGASVEATITLDDTPMASMLWPGSASLQQGTGRSVVVQHDHWVGPPARPVQVTPNVDVFRVAIGSVGESWVYAITKQAPDGTVQPQFGIDGPVWGMSDEPTVVMTEDLSSATASGTMMLYTGSWEDPVEVGVVAVVATWSGVGDAWRWSSTSVMGTPEGRSSVRTVGIHRDATVTLDLGGEVSTGGFAYLEAVTIRQAPRLA